MRALGHPGGNVRGDCPSFGRKPDRWTPAAYPARAAAPVLFPHVVPGVGVVAAESGEALGRRRRGASGRGSGGCPAACVDRRAARGVRGNCRGDAWTAWPVALRDRRPTPSSGRREHAAIEPKPPAQAETNGRAVHRAAPVSQPSSAMANEIGERSGRRRPAMPTRTAREAVDTRQASPVVVGGCCSTRGRDRVPVGSWVPRPAIGRRRSTTRHRAGGAPPAPARHAARRAGKGSGSALGSPRAPRPRRSSLGDRCPPGPENRPPGDPLCRPRSGAVSGSAGSVVAGRKPRAPPPARSRRCRLRIVGHASDDRFRTLR